MTDLQEEAETCRRRAIAYLGRPEAAFLLSAAREFERLAERATTSSGAPEPAAKRQVATG